MKKGSSTSIHVFNVMLMLYASMLGASLALAGPPPKNLSAAVDGTTVNLSWDKSKQEQKKGGSGYHVYRADQASGLYSRLTVDLLVETQYNDVGLNAGSYAYVVTAIDGSGNESNFSSEVLVEISSGPMPRTFPDAGTTGVTEAQCPGWETIKTNTTSRTVNIDGTVIENEEITGTLNIQASNVTIRCAKINAAGTLYGVNCSTGAQCAGLLVENVEIFNCNSACALAVGHPTHPAIWRKVHLHDTLNDLFKMYSNVILEDSYLHGYQPTETSHNDAIQTVLGENMMVRGNRIEGPYQNQTAAWIVQTNNGPVSNVLLEDNYLSGGTYTLYLRDTGNGYGAPSYVVVRNNVWEKDSWQFGPLSSNMTADDCLEWYGNTFSDGTVLDSDIASPPGTCGGSLPAAPPAPENLSASVSGNFVAFMWDASSESDLAGYKLYRKDTSDGPYLLRTPGVVAERFFLDESLVEGAYWYVVTAVLQDGRESAPSSEVLSIIEPTSLPSNDNLLVIEPTSP